MKVYGYMKCGTCRKALKWLDGKRLNYEFIDITLTPPSAKLLRKVLKSGDYELRKLFNTSGIQYRELDIKSKLPGMSETEAVKLLAGNGRLIKRPIIVEDDRVTVGFDAARFESVWG